MTDVRIRPVLALPLALVIGVLAAFFAAGCSEPQAAATQGAQEGAAAASVDAPVPDSLRQATFAGGCFWCTEASFQKIGGVTRAVSGFSGGTTPDPTYDEVAAGNTDYAEAVQVTYDPDQIDYEGLLDVYWRHMDPTDAGGQFADRGSQYRPVIFYHTERQQRLARQSKRQLAESGKFDEPIVVKIQPMERFYVAETYHQDYFEKHPTEYKRYYEGSGRGPFVRETWDGSETADASETSATVQNASASGPSAPRVRPGAGAASQQPAQQVTQQATNARTAPPWSDFEMPSDAELREMLTDMAYRVTQQNGTEPRGYSDLLDNKRPGLYVDVLSGEPLYSSKDKFDSGTGWPSFTQAVDEKFVVEKEDHSMGMVRTEVRSKIADSHLGHIFEDGPEPTGLRHCINGAALKFIPAGELEERGYGMYADRFE